MRLFRNTILLFVLVLILHVSANALYLYWTVWWFDIIVHFLSGAAIAMAAVLLFPRHAKIVTLGVLLSLLLGGVWEGYELHTGLTSLGDGAAYWADTSMDLFIDVLGGFLGVLYSLGLLKKTA